MTTQATQPTTTERHVEAAPDRAEAARLHELEVIIQRGLNTVVEVGRALFEIQTRRLYRETHRTFEDYCKERWGLSRQHVYRQIAAAKVAQMVSPMGDVQLTERQARELAPLRGDPETLREVAEEVGREHGEDATAEDYRDAVTNRLGPSPKQVAWREKQKEQSRLRVAERWAEEIIGLPGRLQCLGGEARDYFRLLDVPRRRAVLHAVGKIAPAAGKLADVLKGLTPKGAGHKSDAARRKG